MPYKSNIKRAKTLRSKGGESAYERAQLLSKVYEDQDFRDDFPDGEKQVALLDDHVQDLCCRFLDLIQMLKAFPSADDWKPGKLRDMMDETYRRLADSRPTQKSAARTRVVHSKKEVAELQRKLEDADYRANALEKQCEEWKAQAATSADTIRQSIAAATAPLQAEIERLSDELEATRARLDKANLTIASLKAQLPKSKKGAA